MSMLVSDIWRVGIINAPISQVAQQSALEQASIHWLEAADSMCFLADPFGLWRDNRLYVFVEAYDYRTRHGHIEVYVFDRHLEFLDQRAILKEPWHLSYPYVFEDGGEIWMLPEGYKSGRLSLYRAVDFPWRWQRVEEFAFPAAAIDASLYRNAKGYWIFYTPPAPKQARTSALMLAHADTLLGRWENVSPQPIHIDRGGARMGGTPFESGDQLVLPTQDCADSYGGALTLLSLPAAQLQRPTFQTLGRLTAPASACRYSDGLHTLSAVGDEFTLIDTKRLIKGSPKRIAIDIGRALRKSR
ncbi:hypothetical protein R84981_001582 [Carnimonas sp. R-84981]|uniref:glucosamine inositolphosphorylceramide transferase family protein n=1 Tax=Carnimonas bestiolae TaxID=3402172 RepID=UPI003EDC0FF9